MKIWSSPGESRGEDALDIMAGGSGPLLQGNEYTGSLYEPGTSETYHLRGSEVYSDLYYANGSVEALTGYGVINSTLYTKSGSTYKELPYKKYYVNGTVQTIYRRGNKYPDTLYVSGGDVTVRRQGDLMKAALYYGGTQRANLKLATFTTREGTALGG